MGSDDYNFPVRAFSLAVVWNDGGTSYQECVGPGLGLPMITKEQMGCVILEQKQKRRISPEGLCGFDLLPLCQASGFAGSF